MSLQNKVLAAILALQAVILVVVFWPRSSGPGIQQFIEGLEEPDVVSVIITDGEGQSIRVNRSPFGCVLPDADDYPCASGRLPDFLQRIVPLTTASLVTDTAESHARFNVAEDRFERTIELELANGSRYKFYLGTSPRGRAGHARLAGDNRVYLAPGLSAFDAPVQADRWVDPVYFSAHLDQVTTLTIENASGKITLAKDENGEWMLDGEASETSIDQDEARRAASNATSIRLSRPLGNQEIESYGLQTPAAVITVTTGENGVEQELRIGPTMAGYDGHVAKSSESPYYVVMHSAAARELITLTNESLLQPPEEATPNAFN